MWLPQHRDNQKMQSEDAEACHGERPNNVLEYVTAVGAWQDAEQASGGVQCVIFRGDLWLQCRLIRVIMHTRYSCSSKSCAPSDLAKVAPR